MFSEGEGVQKQQFDALRKVAVQVRRYSRESMRPGVFRNFAQMIRHAVRTHFRRQRVEEVQHRKTSEHGSEGPLPEARQGWKRLALRPVSSRVDCISDRYNRESQQYSAPNQMHACQCEKERAQASGARHE